MHRDNSSDAEPTECERGQTMVEYAVILGMIVVITMLAFTAIGDGAGNLIDKVTQRLH